MKTNREAKSLSENETERFSRLALGSDQSRFGQTALVDQEWIAASLGVTGEYSTLDLRMWVYHNAGWVPDQASDSDGSYPLARVNGVMFRESTLSAPLGTAQSSLWVLEIYPEPGRPTRISGGIRPAIGPVTVDLAVLLRREIFQGQEHGTVLHEDVIVRTYSNSGRSFTSHAPLALHPESRIICVMTDDPDLEEMGMNDLWVDVMCEHGAIIQYQIGDLVFEFPCQDRENALNPLLDFVAVSRG